jgi:integrase
VDQLQQERGLIIPWVFPRSTTGKPLFDSKTPKASSYFRRKWRAALRTSKLNRRIPHDLRRTAAVSRDNAGMSVHNNMLLGGWSTTAMVERYLKGKQHHDLKRAVQQYDSRRQKNATVTEPLPFASSGR